MAHSAIKGRLILKATLIGTRSSTTTPETERKRFYLLISHLLVYFCAPSRAPLPASPPLRLPEAEPEPLRTPPGALLEPSPPRPDLLGLGGPLDQLVPLGDGAAIAPHRPAALPGSSPFSPHATRFRRREALPA